MKSKKYKYGSHKRLIAWEMADKLDIIVQKILKSLPRNEYKMRRQIDSASDSIGANIVEGHYSGSIKEFIRFLRYARRSLGELQERIRRSFRKDYIPKELYDEFDDVAIKTGYIIDRLIQAKEKDLIESD